MEKLIAGQSSKLIQRMLPGLTMSIGSPASEAGPLPCVSPVGLTVDQSGPEAAPANPSRRRVGKKAKRTKGISGRGCGTKSFAGVHQSRLESRLRALLDVNGSLEYELTWKHWDMSSGVPICALRASARRTSDSDCSGPEADSCDLLGWSAPQWHDGRRPGADLSSTQGGNLSRDVPVFLSGWVAPSARDWKDTPGMSMTGVNPDGSSRDRIDQLPRQVHGIAMTSPDAGTVKRGVLDAEFSRWLMGFPREWDKASPRFQIWCDVQARIALGD